MYEGAPKEPQLTNLPIFFNVARPLAPEGGTLALSRGRQSPGATTPLSAAFSAGEPFSISVL